MCPVFFIFISPKKQPLKNHGKYFLFPKTLLWFLRYLNFVIFTLLVRSFNEDTISWVFLIRLFQNIYLYFKKCFLSMFTKSLPRLNSDLELASGAHFWHIYYRKSIPYIIILFQLTKLHYQNFFPSQDI